MYNLLFSFENLASEKILLIALITLLVVTAIICIACTVIITSKIKALANKPTEVVAVQPVAQPLPEVKEETESAEKVDDAVTFSSEKGQTLDEKYQALEWYEGDEFEINTKIYVIVDFTLINYGAEDDFVEFKIQIPYAKYYSTHEYEKGVVAPKEEYKDLMNDDGSVEPMVELSDMVFNVKAGQIPFHYTYCFSIGLIGSLVAGATKILSPLNTMMMNSTNRNEAVLYPFCICVGCSSVI